MAEIILIQYQNVRDQIDIFEMLWTILKHEAKVKKPKW